MNDQIGIHVGGKAPFAVRPTTSGRFKLLGEVYVLGLVHGEFMKTRVTVFGE